MNQKLIILTSLFVIILTGVFGIFNTTKAQTIFSTVYRQPNFSDATGSSNIGSSNNIWFQSLGTGLEGNFNRILLKATAASSNITLYIYYCDNLDLSPIWSSCDGRTNILSNQSATLTDGYLSWEFSTISFSESSKYYVLQFSATDTNTINFLGSTDATSYSNGICRRAVGGSMTTCPGSIADLYFYVSVYGYTFSDTLVATTTDYMWDKLQELASTTFPTQDCSADNLWNAVNVTTALCHVKNFFMETLRALIIPGENSLDFFLDSLNAFKTTFPFSIVFGTIDLLNNQIGLEINDNSITLPALITDTGITVIPETTILSTTTLRAVNTTSYDLLRDIEEAAIWIALLIAMVVTII